MRSRFVILAAAAAALAVPQFAAASDDIEEQMKLMNDRMSQMEAQQQATQDELEASQDEVARQNDLIEKSGIEREAQSGLSKFFTEVEISGWVAASWMWNWNQPGLGHGAVLDNQNKNQVGSVELEDEFPFQPILTGVNQGRSGGFYPHHPDHNSFSVDQVWFEIQKQATEESRGGFRLDMVYGKTAGQLGLGVQRLAGQRDIDFDGDVDGSSFQGDSASDFNLFQAYVEYLAMPSIGMKVKMGKFKTPIGAESVGTVYNYNITRSANWSFLQPVNHYGLMIDGQTDGGITYGIGIVNQGVAIDPDFNNEKSFLFTGGYSGETFGVTGNMLWDIGSAGDDSPNTSTFNLVATWDPSERFSSYFDITGVWAPNGADCLYLDNDGDVAPLCGFHNTGVPKDNTDGGAIGVALAGRYGITDALGLALRGEFLTDFNNYLQMGSVCVDFGQCGFSKGFTDLGDDMYMFGVTGTLDYSLTDNLMVRGETRWDRIVSGKRNEAEENAFTNKNGVATKKGQITSTVEVVYQF